MQMVITDYILQNGIPDNISCRSYAPHGIFWIKYTE